jgi:hypothetical protein
VRRATFKFEARSELLDAPFRTAGRHTCRIQASSFQMNFVLHPPPTKACLKRSLLGHQGRSFDVRTDVGGRQVISASEDGTCKVWDITNGRCTRTIAHNKEAEVLRAGFLSGGRICTTGSDGIAVIWNASSDGTKLVKEHALQHGADSQLYVCETSGDELLVAADDFLVLWDLQRLERLQEFTFTSIAEPEGPATTGFGGHRNPDNQVFVFDAKYNPSSSNIISVALSDSTTRIVDTRLDRASSTVACVSLARLFAGTSERIGHATSVRARLLPFTASCGVLIVYGLFRGGRSAERGCIHDGRIAWIRTNGADRHATGNAHCAACRYRLVLMRGCVYIAAPSTGTVAQPQRSLLRLPAGRRWEHVHFMVQRLLHQVRDFHHN